jgi:sortase A
VKKYKTKQRSPIRMLMALIAPLLIVAGLAVIGYSFLMGDPFATSALFGAEAPNNSTMKLTVPEMQRVKEVPVYDGAGNDEAALHDGTLHVRGTGFPWQDGSNVYIAGHRMGFPGTKSYQVFKKVVVAPTDYHVTQPVAGRSVVTLQTCTLPDYSDRLIVQAELTSVA